MHTVYCYKQCTGNQSRFYKKRSQNLFDLIWSSDNLFYDGVNQVTYINKCSLYYHI